jgi:hypothetical protein
MTNFEKFREYLLNETDAFNTGVAIVNGKPCSCEDVACTGCDLYPSGKCSVSFVRWLYEEYQEKPKLSERAYHFLKSLPGGARIRECGPHLQIQTQDVCVITSYRDYNYVPELPPLVNGMWYEVSDLLKDELSRQLDRESEIIACGDCKHWICHDRRCGYWNHGVKPLDWCSYAERREEPREN